MLSLHRLGYHLNHKTVAKLMRELGLKSTVRPKRYVSYKRDMSYIAPNILNRNFNANKKNQKWVTDITEFNIDGNKVYLSPVIDLFNQEVISYKISTSVRLKPVMDMLNNAIRRLSPMEKPLLHSDQGWQYKMKAYQYKLIKHGIIQSMSRKGNCLDDSVYENFFGILKTEFFYGNKFKDIKTFIRELKEYINYYNHEKIKQKTKWSFPY